MNNYADYIDPEDFREWVVGADKKVLEEFILEIEDDILELEGYGFFGTEGLNKRLG